MAAYTRKLSRSLLSLGELRRVRQQPILNFDRLAGGSLLPRMDTLIGTRSPKTQRATFDSSPQLDEQRSQLDRVNAPQDAAKCSLRPLVYSLAQDFPVAPQLRLRHP